MRTVFGPSEELDACDYLKVLAGLCRDRQKLQWLARWSHRISFIVNREADPQRAAVIEEKLRSSGLLATESDRTAPNVISLLRLYPAVLDIEMAQSIKGECELLKAVQGFLSGLSGPQPLYLHDEYLLGIPELLENRWLKAILIAEACASLTIVCSSHRHAGNSDAEKKTVEKNRKLLASVPKVRLETSLKLSDWMRHARWLFSERDRLVLWLDHGFASEKTLAAFPCCPNTVMSLAKAIPMRGSSMDFSSHRGA